MKFTGKSTLENIKENGQHVPIVTLMMLHTLQHVQNATVSALGN